MDTIWKSVTSRDGTTIGFRQMGSGPAAVILHGGALASQHYRTLGAALADRFTVCIPDRRGRGMSGPYGPDYCIEREDEDLAAIVAATGAERVFGTADGGLFALHGAATLPQIRKVAVFEPVLFVGQPGVCRALLALDALVARGDRVALRDLVPALIPELRVVAATEDTIDYYRGVRAECLLMCGTGAPPLFTATRDALLEVLPHARTVDLPGANHGAAQDQGGSPAAIAERLGQFFD